jgi:enoyl-CoA hydratase/carnithine racemase
MQSDVRNTPPASKLDDDTFEFANAVFDLARAEDGSRASVLTGVAKFEAGGAKVSVSGSI